MEKNLGLRRLETLTESITKNETGSDISAQLLTDVGK
jgi:hypothetical protein